jgi:hypothetical protein
VVVPLPFQVKFELVCTATPLFIVLPVALVVNVLLPPGLVGVCNTLLTVSTPFKVNVEADMLTFGVVIVPLEFEVTVPLFTVRVLLTDKGALMVSVPPVTVKLLLVDKVAFAIIVPLVTVMLPLTVKAAFIVRVVIVLLPIVSDEQLTAEFMVG